MVYRVEGILSHSRAAHNHPPTAGGRARRSGYVGSGKVLSTEVLTRQ
ncbi:hypothetical protein FRIGORI9N_310058 [Frigoribacterium sp. 9N]|nr:hypothetical protein FRIGORI9N_310058 [Frigoribacterium sp. 9N]